MIPLAYMSRDRKTLVFADSQDVKTNGFAGMIALYDANNEVLELIELRKKIESIQDWYDRDGSVGGLSQIMQPDD